jgi:hypothetical protein
MWANTERRTNYALISEHKLHQSQLTKAEGIKKRKKEKTERRKKVSPRGLTRAGGRRTALSIGFGLTSEKALPSPTH